MARGSGGRMKRSRAKTASRPDARSAALRLLARRDYSRLELAHKLGGKSYPEEQVATALDQMEELGYLSEQRFAEMLVRSRISGGFGPVKIRFELREKGVPEQLAEQAILEAGPDWLALARAVRNRHFGDFAPADLRERARQCRYLQSRGFTTDQVRYAVNWADE